MPEDGADRALADRLITAEQDERRRLALFLHDGAVQSLSGIALMLDAVGHAIDDGRVDDAKQILASALDRHRQTIQSLRDLSFNLEPVVLRDQGLVAAVRALAEQLGPANGVRIELDVDGADAVADKAQVVIYQIAHDALNQSVRRGAKTVTLRVAHAGDEWETVVTDDGNEERRQGNFEALDRRARTLSGRAEAERSADGRTVVRVTLPAYAAQG
jgi:two-component system sensor histidine kinase UhpB